MIIIMSVIILSQVDKRRRERSVWRLASLSKLRQGSLPGQNDNNNENDTATSTANNDNAMIKIILRSPLASSAFSQLHLMFCSNSLNLTYLLFILQIHVSLSCPPPVRSSTGQKTVHYVQWQARKTCFIYCMNMKRRHVLLPIQLKIEGGGGRKRNMFQKPQTGGS